MLDGLFACADCGYLANGCDAILIDPPDGNYVGDSESVKVVLAKNKMAYIGCPECNSPNVYFSRKKRVITNNFPAHEIPQPVDKRISNIRQTIVSESPAIGGGKNVCAKVDVEIDGEIDILPQEDHVDDIFGSLDEELVGSTDESLQETEKLIKTKKIVKLQSGEEREIDVSKTGIGKIRQHVPRELYKRKCNRCESEFQTKHQDMLICKKCTSGFTK